MQEDTLEAKEIDAEGLILLILHPCLVLILFLFAAL